MKRKPKPPARDPVGYLKELAQAAIGRRVAVQIYDSMTGWHADVTGPSKRKLTKREVMRALEVSLLELLGDPVRGGSPLDALSQRDQLWQLLDDIDTQDDACREHDDVFRKRVRRIQKKRWAIYKPSGT